MKLEEKGKWARVNMDETKDFKKCKQQVSLALKSGQNVVIDMCNDKRKTRIIWFNHAKENNASAIDAIYFDFPKDVCIKRCEARKRHPTVVANKARSIVNLKHKTFQVPTAQELSYASLTVLSTAGQIQAHLKTFK
eukprot:TRINITY_DN8180_c0_g1_i2.p1 TRINITY_DN8180_c0_g1~~TRINITY_DN8180_c0_g1_i2.p1  ORF type:complete len:136 (+),score=23.42 TRINITY_DN8180_c0_g1_i2:286-693(+)